MSNDLKSLSSFVLYTAPSGDVKLEVFLQDETLWLTQKMMAELFGVDVRTINEHLRNIYQSKELVEDSTIRKIRIVQDEGGRGVSRKIDFYNLDVIIAVGYRVNSRRAIQFRIWASRVLNDYKILNDNGRVSKENADKKALAEYKEYNKTQPIESDFDRVVKKLIISNSSAK